MKHLIWVFISIIILADCSYIGSAEQKFISPERAITLTSENNTHSVSGDFQFQVKSMENQYRMTFLNSEADSKDQRNFIVVIRPRVVKQLEQKYGDDLGKVFLDRDITVNGTARRQKIWVLHRNLNTGQYYYQTKIFVKSAEQISLL